MTDPTAPFPACPWCSSPDTILLRRGLSRQGPLVFDIRACNGCGCRFSPQAVEAAVDYEQVKARHAWYHLAECEARMVHAILANGPEPFWVNMAVQFLGRVPWNVDRRHRAVLHAMATAAAQGRRLRVAEVGCNHGLVGGLAARMGHDYLGVDLPNSSLDCARRDFGPFGARFEAVAPSWFQAGLGGPEFDLVYSSETIEHVGAPRLFLQRLLELTAPGGRLVLTTPDLEYSPGDLWATALPPIHVVFLRKTSLSRVLPALAPGCTVECYNEVLGEPPPPPPAATTPDAALRAPAETLDADPASPGFRYLAANLGQALVPPPGRPAAAASAPPRATGSSIIAEIVRAPTATAA